VGPYELLEHVGSGGNARVFRAVGLDGQEVALKLLRPGRASAEDLKRFEREFKSLHRLDHANVIQVYAAGESDGHAWLAMEYVDGPDLGRLVASWNDREPQDRWTRVVRILRGLCSGLAAVHESGIVHRDLKPSNVLVGRDGVPKLTDFGVVKGDELFSTNLTIAGQLLGTVAFMSPEQITGEKLDARSDLYALGAMLYVLLTGQRPIVADSIASYLARHLASEPKRPQILRPDVPDQLERICLRLLRKNPAGRFSSAMAVLSALDGASPEPSIELVGQSGALARAQEILVGFGRDDIVAMGFVGPRGSGRTAMVEAVADLARGMGYPVGLATDEWDGIEPRVVLADDLHLREGLHLGELIERVFHGPSLLVWSAVALPGSNQAESTSLLPQLDMLAGPVFALTPLDRTDTVVLLRQLGVSGRLGPLLGRRLQAELRGLPGVMVRQLECLEEQGWLGREKGRLVAAVAMEHFRSRPLPVPDVLRSELLERFRQVMPAGRRLLQVLAVVGGQANADLLRSLAPVTNHDLKTRALSRLIQIEEKGLERLVMLQHPRLARVLYEDLSPAERVAVHGQVADALMARHACRPGNMASVMADHLVRAQQPERAWPLLVRAARRAARRRDPVQALNLANRARQAGDLAKGRMPEGDRRQLERESLALRGEALLACRQPVLAREALTAALELGAQEDATALSARSALGAALVALGEAGPAALILGPLLGRLDLGHPARPAALRAMAEAQRMLGKFAQSEATWREGLALARELGSREPEGLCLLGLAGTALQSNQLTVARDALNRAMPLLRTVRSDGLPLCLRHLAELEALNGSYRIALTLAEEAAELAQAKEDLETWGGALAVTADILDLAGSDRDAERIRGEIRSVRAAVESGVKPPQVSLASQTCLDDALALEAQGAHFPALGRVEEAWERLPESGADGLAHRVALALCRLDPDTHRHGRASKVVRAIAEELPPHLAVSFRARPDVADLLN
jgi:tetratricopeptide (TPR) repeat protein/predicted Ser/Thr protein kinase